MQKRKKEINMKIKKIEPRTYTYELCPEKSDKEFSSCMWARFIFDCDNGRLNINSDAGDYTYAWGHSENEDFMHLMSRVGEDYLLNKLSDRSVFLLEESQKELIESIETYWYDFGFETEAEWKECKQELLELSSFDAGNEYAFFNRVQEIIPDIDSDSIYIEMDYPYQAKLIVNWFIKYLQPKIKEEFAKES